VTLRILLTLTLIVIILITNSYAYAQTGITVKDAIELALENNESYLKAKNELEKAQNLVTEVRASAFPQLTTVLNVVHNWELPTIIIPEFGEITMGTVNNLMANLTITQPIYNGGRVFSAWSVARSYKKFSRYQLDMSKRQLELEVINAFWMAVMADELLRVTGQSLKLAEEGLDVVKA